MSPYGACSHDDVALVIRRSQRTGSSEHARPGPTGWSHEAAPRRAPRIRRHLPALVLLIPLVVGLLGAPATTNTARGDELSDAKAKSSALKKEIAEQKAQIAAINDLQSGLAAEISDTKNQLRKIGADLDKVRKKIASMQAKINQVKAVY